MIQPKFFTDLESMLNTKSKDIFETCIITTSAPPHIELVAKIPSRDITLSVSIAYLDENLKDGVLQCELIETQRGLIKEEKLMRMQIFYAAPFNNAIIDIIYGQLAFNGCTSIQPAKKS